MSEVMAETAVSQSEWFRHVGIICRTILKGTDNDILQLGTDFLLDFFPHFIFYKQMFQGMKVGED